MSPYGWVAPPANAMQSGFQVPGIRPIPVTQRRISFNGGKPTMPNDLNLHEFLCQVEAFRRAEGYSEDDMSRKVFHLLSGKARAGFRSLARSSSSQLNKNFYRRIMMLWFCPKSNVESISVESPSPLTDILLKYRDSHLSRRR